MYLEKSHAMVKNMQSWNAQHFTPSTHLVPVVLHAFSFLLHSQPSRLALAHNSQVGYREQPSARTRAKDRGLPTSASPWKYDKTFTTVQCMHRTILYDMCVLYLV